MCCLTHVFFLALLVLAHGGHYLNSEDEEREEKIPERAKPEAGARWAKRKYSDWEEDWYTFEENSQIVMDRWWPWAAVITMGSVAVGIGSLVKPNWLLTSAHCVSILDDEIFVPNVAGARHFPHFAVFRINYLEHMEHEKHEDVFLKDYFPIIPWEMKRNNVTRTIIHPEYVKGIKQHDIALLKIIVPDSIAHDIQLVQFAQELPQPGMECLVPAFGSCRKNFTKYSYFMEHRVIIADQSQCRDMLRRDRVDDVADVPIGAVFDSILYEKYLEELSLLKFCTKAFMWKADWEPFVANLGGPVICNGRMYGLATSAFHSTDIDHVFYLVTGTAEQLLWINRVFTHLGEKPIVNRLLKIENHASHHKTLRYLIGTIGFLTLGHVFNINNHL